MCVDPTQEIEILGLIVNSQAMTLSITSGKDREDKGSLPRLCKATEVSLLALTKLIRTLSSTIQAVHPAHLQFHFLQQQQIVYVSLTSFS